MELEKLRRSPPQLAFARVSDRSAGEAFPEMVDLLAHGLHRCRLCRRCGRAISDSGQERPGSGSFIRRSRVAVLSVTRLLRGRREAARVTRRGSPLALGSRHSSFALATIALTNDHFGRISPARQIAQYGELPFRDFLDPGYFLTEFSSAALLRIFGDTLLGEWLFTSPSWPRGTVVVFAPGVASVAVVFDRADRGRCRTAVAPSGVRLRQGPVLSTGGVSLLALRRSP